MTTGQTIQFFVTIAVLLSIYSFKWALQFQYLRVQNKKKPGHWSDYYKRNFIYKKDPQWWKESLLLFPLLFPVPMTGKEKEDAWLTKIKRTNIVMYFALIILLLTGIYFAKLPANPY